MACVLPSHYFHDVFTLPHEIGALALRNRKTIFNLLFSARPTRCWNSAETGSASGLSSA
jgi:hypothetical protein